MDPKERGLLRQKEWRLGHGANAGAPGLRDAEVSGLVAALIGRGGEAGQGGELLAAGNLSPGEELEGEQPGGLEPDALEGHELADHSEGGIGAVVELLSLEVLEEADALGDLGAVLPLTE
jgi:hypothetical protein